jgi:hypothetical protein
VQYLSTPFQLLLKNVFCLTTRCTCLQAKVVLPVLLRQVAINVKVLAESASLCVEQILKTCHAHRLIALVCESARDRAVSIRRKCFAFCNLVIRTWPTDKLKRQLAGLTAIVLEGQMDADAEVRKSARASYWVSFPLVTPPPGDVVRVPFARSGAVLEGV